MVNGSLVFTSLCFQGGPGTTRILKGNIWWNRGFCQSTDLCRSSKKLWIYIFCVIRVCYDFWYDTEVWTQNASRPSTWGASSSGDQLIIIFVVVVIDGQSWALNFLVIGKNEILLNSWLRKLAAHGVAGLCCIRKIVCWGNWPNTPIQYLPSSTIVVIYRLWW